MGMAMMALISSALMCGAGESWQAGVGRVDITPEESVWLAGYAGRDHASQGTLHPIWVKALALEDAQGQRAVVVATDILGYTKPLADRIRARLAQDLQLSPAQIILNASHTHSGPVIDESLLCIYPLDDAELAKVKKYTATLEDKVVRAVHDAFDGLQPAQLASANGVCRFAVNRRNNKEAEILSTHDFNGPVDHAVPVLRVSGPDGALRAVLFGYACHCTTLNGYEWCGDYAGFAQITLEQAHPGCTALFFAGCGADQNPLPRRTVALATQYGQELAAAVTRALCENMTTLEPALVTRYEELDLALQTPPSRDELLHIAQTGAPYMQRAAQDQLRVLDAGDQLRSSYPYPVTLWRLGQQSIAALGGEVVVDYAVFLKDLLGNDTFVMGYSNDVMGYIPSERVLQEGGYEGASAQLIYGLPSPWAPGIEQRILDTARKLAGEAAPH